MSAISFINDRFRNLVANLGTERDKAFSSEYTTPYETDDQLCNAYDGAWLPKKIIDIPALDATRKWREWQGDSSQVEAIKAEEKRLGLRSKTREAIIIARLFGGSVIYIGTRDDNQEKPLNLERIKKGGVDFLTVISRRNITAGEMERDPMLENYGKPRYYEVSGSAEQVRIHPSRIARFIGTPTADAEIGSGPQQEGWGRSVLTALWDAIRNADSTAANIASLVFEAKIDVISIPDLMSGMADDDYRDKLIERFQLAAKAKGINGTLLLDKEEEYNQKNQNFASLTDVLFAFMQLVSGAADIPTTRLLGQSPAGMNATGESDLRNYYDRIASMQEVDVSDSLLTIDEALIRSALGSRPKETHYIWSSLWQTTDTERADIGEKTANTIKTLAETRLFPEEAISQAGANLLVERSVMPGLEAALEEFPADPGGDRDDDLAATAPNEEETT